MEEKLKQIMADVFEMRPEEISRELTMDECDRWDSLRHMELVAALEDNFDIGTLELDEIVAITTFVSMLELMESKLSG